MMRMLYAVAEQSDVPVDPLRIWEVAGVWVGGVGAAIAAGVAVWLAVGERKRARKERDDARARTLREQANQVYAWVDTVMISEYSYDMASSARWQNASNQPVWDFETEALRAFDAMSGDTARPIRHKFLPPGHVQEEALGRTFDYHEGTQAVWCSFRDASGNTWEKDNDGSLTVISGPDATEIRSYEHTKQARMRRFPPVFARIQHSWREAPRQYRDRLN